jgi:hypothetical protein
MDFLEHTKARLAEHGYGISVDEAAPDVLIERCGLAVRGACLVLAARIAGDLGDDGIETVIARLGAFGVLLANCPPEATGTDFLRGAFSTVDRPIYDILLLTGVLLARLGIAWADAQEVPYEDGVLTLLAATAAGLALEEPASLDLPDFVVQVFRGVERLAGQLSG